jgi:hypothetical protein
LVAAENGPENPTQLAYEGMIDVSEILKDMPKTFISLHSCRGFEIDSEIDVKRHFSPFSEVPPSGSTSQATSPGGEFFSPWDSLSCAPAGPSTEFPFEDVQLTDTFRDDTTAGAMQEDSPVLMDLAFSSSSSGSTGTSCLDESSMEASSSCMTRCPWCEASCKDASDLNAHFCAHLEEHSRLASSWQSDSWPALNINP